MILYSKASDLLKAEQGVLAMKSGYCSTLDSLVLILRGHIDGLLRMLMVIVKK